MADKYVYFFGEGKAEGTKEMKHVLGGKGANLAEMTNIGVPVPPGFTISTEVCDYYYKHDKTYPKELADQTDENLKKLEKSMGKKLGDVNDPLLVSVRSGAASSMPGMMDTVLNLGLSDAAVEGLSKKTSNQRFAWDAYRRFITMFADVVCKVDRMEFEDILDEVKEKKGVTNDTELNTEDLKEIAGLFKAKFKELTGDDFPQDARTQLQMSIDAVFGSWNNERAIKYRRLNNITGLLGTAVNVQSMVYGNMGDHSATGVCFSRDPSTGENVFYGEYLVNAQGEDVVAGIRTPYQITKEGSLNWSKNHNIPEDDRKNKYPSLEEYMPVAFKELVQIKNNLEKHYRDMQDMEFTIQENKLYFLQTRNGKRTAASALRIATDMVKEGVINEEEAVMRIEPEQLDQLLHPRFDPNVKVNAIAKGLPASPGAAMGEIVFTAKEAEDAATAGKSVILVRLETSPEDIGGMAAAKGILTARGGMTSHAAVVARGMGKCCVAGCHDLTIQKDGCTIKSKKFKKGDIISLNGSTGEVIEGKVELIEPDLSGDFGVLIGWANKLRKMKVRTNADTPFDAEVARKFGAEGIGLCRTEHMFFDGDRIDAFREMILAEDLEGRKKALAKILPIQKKDFIGIFTAMRDLPVTIRLLDPPLHEFLPHTDKDISDLAKKIGVSADKLKIKSESLKEFNPMLGHRGCRLAVTFPEIAAMQTEAIISAACELIKDGHSIIPEIMVPLVGHYKELEMVKAVIDKTADDTMNKYGVKVEYKVGTMIEVPRACVTADEIAEYAEFFSFGTNDLTQMGFGFSRDDAGVFLGEYVEKGIFERDPFQALDQDGIGALMKIAVEKGKQTRSNIKLGICGEHGGEPSSVKFCRNIGLDYVSCSPYRVPIAILAAAQAEIEKK
jgi:pyruvate,orthophosphate dikinase